MFRSNVSSLRGKIRTTSFELEFARDAYEPYGHLSPEEVRKAWPYDSIGLESMELQRDLRRRPILANGLSNGLSSGTCSEWIMKKL